MLWISLQTNTNHFYEYPDQVIIRRKNHNHLPWRWEGESVGLVTFQYRGFESESELIIEGGIEQIPSSLTATLIKPEKEKQQ